MSIGTGALPAPSSAPSGTTGWVVEGSDATKADKYYRLGVDGNSDPAWFDDSGRLLREDDPVLFANGSAVSIASLAATGTVDLSEYVQRSEFASDIGAVSIHGGYF